MKAFHLLYSAQARKDFKRLDPPVARLLYAWLSKNIEGCDNPRAHGKALSGNRAGQWRYRIGSHRIICQIQDDAVIVLVLTVGHRKNVYR